MEIKEAINICSVLYKKKHLTTKEKDALSQLMQIVIYEVLERSDNSGYAKCDYCGTEKHSNKTFCYLCFKKLKEIEKHFS